MIIVRAPLRITLGGGGTDLASYYREYGGLTLTAAIDKYIYITIHETFVDDLIIKYSQLERVTKREQIEHPIFKAVTQYTNLSCHGLEISSIADIPSGTGLGSSSSFTVALLKAIQIYLNQEYTTTHALAESACHIEIDMLGEHIGKQDQFIAAYGGIRNFSFTKTGDVIVEPAHITQDTRLNLEDNLLLFFTGYSRSASKMLDDQLNYNHTSNLRALHELAFDTKNALECGDLDEFAELLNTQWELKKSRSRSASNAAIDHWYTLGRNNGASGGKLVGAGGGGFLMFYAESKIHLRDAMRDAGLREVRFRFDNEGAKAIY